MKFSDFEKRKKAVLVQLYSEKKDKSKQGFLDEEIKNLVNLINDKKNCYTTSSCAGRILILFRPETKIKSDVVWIYKSHQKSDFEIIMNSLNDFLKSNTLTGQIIFKQEPMIIHIATSSLDIANQLMTVAGDCGFRRKGIISFSKRIILEVTSSNTIEFPIGQDSNLSITENFLKYVLGFANNNIDYNKKMIDKFENEIKHKDF